MRTEAAGHDGDKVQAAPVLDTWVSTAEQSGTP